jgi:hypothetical protein
MHVFIVGHALVALATVGAGRGLRARSCQVLFDGRHDAVVVVDVAGFELFEFIPIFEGFQAFIECPILQITGFCLKIGVPAVLEVALDEDDIIYIGANCLDAFALTVNDTEYVEIVVHQMCSKGSDRRVWL